jgi:hypothetical protein
MTVKEELNPLSHQAMRLVITLQDDEGETYLLPGETIRLRLVMKPQNGHGETHKLPIKPFGSG